MLGENRPGERAVNSVPIEQIVAIRASGPAAGHGNARSVAGNVGCADADIGARSGEADAVAAVLLDERASQHHTGGAAADWGIDRQAVGAASKLYVIQHSGDDDARKASCVDRDGVIGIVQNSHILEYDVGGATHGWLDLHTTTRSTRAVIDDRHIMNIQASSRVRRERNPEALCRTRSSEIGNMRLENRE